MGIRRSCLVLLPIGRGQRVLCQGTDCLTAAGGARGEGGASASISAKDRVIGSGDNESQGSGERAPPSAPRTRSRDGFRGERGPLRLPQRYTIPACRPARPPVRPRGGGAAGPGGSRSLCNQCSPDLIPGRTHPTGSRGPGRDNSQRREPQTRAPAGHLWLAKARRTAREFEK